MDGSQVARRALAGGPAGRLVSSALLVVLAAIGACRPSAPSTGYEHLNDMISESLGQVGLGPGDVFEARVYGEKELSGTHQIAPDGSIDFPLVGHIHVAGMTPGDVATLLKERLQAGYIRDPFVSVYVKEYQSKKIFVLGQVNKPGTFAFGSAMTVVEAITLAGGFKDTANTDYVVVTRKVDGREMRIPVPVGKISKGLAANLELRSGDIVFVSDTLL
ncbi:MAG: polysaccharide export protein [Deltaproteobacteria bacterium]|nr:polysaccharide export protein [Deltaproteobacteria bacterium]MCB9785550.1 polysaccharide export protein [Deltaproteobacteria bacterium]